MATQIGQDIVDRKDHLTQRAFLHERVVEVGPERGLANVHPTHDAWANRAKAVHAFDAQHRARVGIAKVLAPHVITGRKARDILPHLSAAHVAHRLTNNHRHLTFVVEILRAVWTHERTPVAVQRRCRLLEIRRRFNLRDAELGPARFIIQVNAQDFAWFARRQIGGLGLMNRSAIAQQQPVAVRLDPLGLAFVQNPPPFRPRSLQYTHTDPPL